jgi:hypothetical protein
MSFAELGQHIRPLLAFEGALLHHEPPLASMLLPDHDTLLVIGE